MKTEGNKPSDNASPPASPNLPAALAAFEALRTLRIVLDRLQGWQLSLGYTVILAQIGVAADVSVVELDRVVRDLRQKRASMILSLFEEGLLAGGTSVGEPFGLSQKGRELAQTAMGLVEQELMYALNGSVTRSDTTPLH